MGLFWERLLLAHVGSNLLEIGTELRGAGFASLVVGKFVKV